MDVNLKFRLPLLIAYSRGGMAAILQSEDMQFNIVGKIIVRSAILVTKRNDRVRTYIERKTQVVMLLIPPHATFYHLVGKEIGPGAARKIKRDHAILSENRCYQQRFSEHI